FVARGAVSCVEGLLRFVRTNARKCINEPLHSCPRPGTVVDMRFLVVARLSHSTAASTSIDRQLDTCAAEVAKLGGQLVGRAVDDDVSGISVRPEDRPSLGPWLTEDRAPEYDALIVYRVDRLARSVFDLHRIARWLKDHD